MLSKKEIEKEEVKKWLQSNEIPQFIQNYINQLELDNYADNNIISEYINIVRDKDNYIEQLESDKQKLIEKLEKENIILKVAKEEVEELLENSIPKEVIEEKVKELEKAGIETIKENWKYIYEIQKDILKELLEGK